MVRRVLIVSPNFPPVNTPDHQRIRMSLPYFREFGWKPYVLAMRPDVRPDQRKSGSDPLLEESVPKQVKVVRTRAMQAWPFSLMGEGSLSIRALPHLSKAGNQIIANAKIDLIYISTTLFPTMALGPRWKTRFGIPYILDFQDPWFSSYYESPGAPTPPGGAWKHMMSQIVARILEPYAMREVEHIISVSPAYPQMLRKRYAWLGEDKFTVLPFGAAEKDFECLETLNVTQSVFDPGDGKAHWSYVGRGGSDMAKALRVLFWAIRYERDRNPERFTNLKLHFVGTDYAPSDRAVKTVEPIAHECGVGDLVEELTGRVSYFEALKILTDSNALLLFGSDDPGYTASKLYPCILARKPILAVFHEQSTVVDVLRRCNAGRAVTFASDTNPKEAASAARVKLDWLLSLPRDYEPETDWQEFQPHTAREMTRRQCEILDRCLID